MDRKQNNSNSYTDENNTNSLIKKSVAKRKKRAAIIRNTAITVVCIALGIVISIQYKSLSAAEHVPSSDADTITSLQAQLIKLSQNNDALSAENEDLEKQIDLLKNSTNEEQIKKLEEEANQLKMFSGLSNVTGRGIYISIASIDKSAPSIQQWYLLNIINELKASGAQAISLNGERITAMTEVRVPGNYIVINGNNHYPPYEIYAIGQQANMYSGMDLNGSGPLNKMKEAIPGCVIQCVNKDEIVINASKEIKMDLLKNAD